MWEYSYVGKHFEKRYVFKRLQKTARVCADLCASIKSSMTLSLLAAPIILTPFHSRLGTLPFPEILHTVNRLLAPLDSFTDNHTGPDL